METLAVEKRDESGTSASRKLRKAGNVPVILYGHGQENQKLTVSQKAIKNLIRRNAKMVQLEGDASDTVLMSEFQWDALGIDILHVDLVRVDLKQKVAVTVPVQLHGEPAGSKAGGMFLQSMHSVDISCPAGSIPDSVGMDVSNLGVGEHCSARDLVLPDGAELVTAGDAMVAQVEKPRGMKKADAEAKAEEG